MIIKDYFADGLLQIAIVLSLLRSDLDSFLETSARPLVAGSHLLEANDGPLSGITRTDVNIHLRGFVREYPKTLHSYNDGVSSVLRDLHSLSYYRRFNGISTNVDAWLVNDGSPDDSTSSCERSTGDDVTEASASSQNISSPPTTEDISVVTSEPNSMNLFVEDELSKEDMELINILYLQDVDIGIGREAFDDLCTDAAVNVVEQKQLELKQTSLTEDGEHCHSATHDTCSGQQSVDSYPSFDGSHQYVIDTETGELVLASSSAVRQSLNVDCDHCPSSQSDHDVSSAATDSSFTGGAVVSGHPDDHQPTQNDDGESSYEERWEDMLGLLDLQSVLEGEPMPHVGTDADWDWQNASASLALMHNVSMTQPIVSSATLSYHDVASMQPPASYDLTPVNNESLPFFESVCDFDMTQMNLSCETPQWFSNAVTSRRDVADFICDDGAAQTTPDTTLSTTVAHYSSASAALNNMLTHSVGGAELSRCADSVSSDVTNISDTNALFHQLLCTNLLLDELDYGNSTFLSRNVATCDNWSSDDSAVSSMHSPSIESPTDVVTGADGFTDDVSSEHSAAAASHGDKYNVAECDYSHYGRAVRSLASSLSSSCSTYSNCSSMSSGEDHQKNVQHNHTYPISPGQRSRSERDAEARRERDEHATRCRDEKKAKDMQIPLTMEEIIDSTVEHFNELLSEHKLSEGQNQLVRDIRRRGKNKLAAQNCRKRKLEVIQTVEDELLELRRERDKLLQEKLSLDKLSASLKHKFSSLEAELFERLHNETGQNYDRDTYSVLQTDDGRLFIVPRDSSTDHDQQNKRKRKPEKKE